MALSKKQTKSLLDFVANSRPDSLDCDGCFEHMAEFVEHELAGKEIPEAYASIEQHLQQCACCRDEHDALIQGLKALEE